MGTGCVLSTGAVRRPAVALALSCLSAIGFAAAATWAAWRSGWNPAYGMSLGFSLGALIPNEVWPYQWLPLLPLVLLLVLRGIERRRFGSLACLAGRLSRFYRAPYDLLFPHICEVAACRPFV